MESEGSLPWEEEPSSGHYHKCDDNIKTCTLSRNRVGSREGVSGYSPVAEVCEHSAT
jgi:hypothetical protein